jgi:Zn ribbon nucleic-acid-binding protein
MDSIFEEEADEVGGEIEAYCPSPRCKADTTHTIISMYEDEVRRVQCVVCGEVHAYRKPRGDGAEAEGEGGKKHGARRVTWDEAMARASDNDLANCRPYSIRDTYEEGDVVHHPVFDIGFVVEQLPDNKVEVIFRDGGARILVHNRGDLASRMPDIAEVPAPREAKKKKRAKKQEAAPAPVPQRSKAEVEAAVVRARGAAQARVDEAARSADERNKKLKAEAKKTKGTAKAAPVKAVAAKVAAVAGKAAAAINKVAAVVKPAAKTAPKPAKAAAKPAKAAAKPAKAAAKGAAKKPAKKAAPAKKPAKAAAKKPAKKPAPKKKK